VAGLLIAGCGGGGSDESSETTVAPTTATTTALSKAELIEQGDAICAEVNAAVGETGSGSEESSTPAAQVASLYSGMVNSLNNLGAPQEAAGYAEFSEAAEELAMAENEVKLAAERSETEGLESAESKASSALASFQNAASEYGFKDCSEGPSAPVAGSASPGTESEAGEAEAGGAEAEAVEPEPVQPEVEEEAAPEVAPETGGAEGGGGATGAPEAGGGSTGGGSSGGIGPG
jgi:ubiquinol-cytochrome c reductase cytochrome c1 subunit